MLQSMHMRSAALQTAHSTRCPTWLSVKQEARNLWQQVCSTQNFAADLALIAEAHALLAGPEQTGSKDNVSSLTTADQNGFVANGEAHREVTVVIFIHHPHHACMRYRA